MEARAARAAGAPGGPGGSEGPGAPGARGARAGPGPGPGAGEPGLLPAVQALMRELAEAQAGEAAAGAGGAPPAAPPEASAAGAPGHAREFWKAAAVGPGGVPVSVFDGVTEYRVGGPTVFQAARRGHGGGIYVYRTIEDYLRADADTFPRSCALARADRLLLRVLAWEEGHDDAPIRYGHKLAFSYVRAVEALAYPRSWSRPLADRAPPAAVESPPARGDRGRELRRKKGLRQRQADTIALEQEVLQMERLAAERAERGFSSPQRAVRGH